jgi:predicted acetyltransferase
MELKNIHVVLARADQQSVVAQLMELYIYDFAQVLGLDLGDNGRYGYEYLPLYWREPHRFPFLIWIDQKLAGFALIQQGSPIESDASIWDVSEFFILRKFRRMGAGQEAAHWIWNNFPGRWQVRVLATHQNASDFWKEAVTSFTVATKPPSKRRVKEKDWLIYQFESPSPTI